MLGCSPNPKIWQRVNKVIMGENAAVTLVTILNGLSMMLIHAGVATNEQDARVHLAAMLLSPDNGQVGALADELPEHFAKLSGQKGGIA